MNKINDENNLLKQAINALEGYDFLSAKSLALQSIQLKKDLNEAYLVLLKAELKLFSYEDNDVSLIQQASNNAIKYASETSKKAVIVEVSDLLFMMCQDYLSLVLMSLSDTKPLIKKYRQMQTIKRFSCDDEIKNSDHPLIQLNVKLINTAISILLIVPANNLTSKTSQKQINEIINLYYNCLLALNKRVSIYNSYPTPESLNSQNRILEQLQTMLVGNEYSTTKSLKLVNITYH